MNNIHINKKIQYISCILFIVHMLFKPFYFNNPGHIQLADYIFICSNILFLISSKGFNIISKNDISIVIFIFLVTAINTSYFIIYKETQFLKSILFYIYNLLIIIQFRNILKNKTMIMLLIKVLQINIIIQMTIYLLNIGRYFNETSSRYMGLFNDPNQMAFFLLVNYLIISVLLKKMSIKNNIAYYIITFFLILKTESTGIFISFALFSFLSTVYLVYKSKKYQLLTIVVVMFTIALMITNSELLKYISDNNMTTRIQYKFNKIDNTSNSKSYDDLNLIEERVLDKLYLYPYYNIIGSGEGKYGRFSNAAQSSSEIHSTIFGILFYYGLIPTFLLLKWFISNISGIKLIYYPAVVSLIVESFFLQNIRQSFFWIFFITVSYNYDMVCQTNFSKLPTYIKLSNIRYKSKILYKEKL